MSTTESGRTRRTGTRWVMVGIGLAIAIAYLVAGLASDNVRFAIGGAAIMVVTTVAWVVLSRYSETAKGLLDHTDERINSIDRDATLFAGAVLLLVVLGMLVVEIAQGKDGSPYVQLGCVGAVAYFVALLWLRLRR